MTQTVFLGLTPFQWVAVVVLLLTPALLLDALAGHYRRAFSHKVQYAPFVSGTLLVVITLAMVLWPDLRAIRTGCALTGWLCVVTGALGFVAHQYYGTYRKPGGYHQALHYALYGAPPLAPLALSVMGLLAVMAARGLGGGTSFGGINLRVALLGLTAVALLGAVLQAGLLHYRGAFNNFAMYLPVTVPVLAILLLFHALLTPRPEPTALGLSLWLTLLTGFGGLGMHLRGFDRQMGGLYLPLFNVLQGPPVWAPAAFSGFAVVGLIATYLLH